MIDEGRDQEAAEDPVESSPAAKQSQFDKFSGRAKLVLQLAQEEAKRFNHNYIGTEHLLLGLVREGDGVAARVLNSLGVQLPKVRSAVEFIIGRGESVSEGVVAGEILLTPRAKKVLELAVDEGRRLDHQYIGTEHLLLGLVREGEGIAAGVLESVGVNLDTVRAQVMSLIAQSNLEPGPEKDTWVWPPALLMREDRLSDAAREVLESSAAIAHSLNHSTVGTEHLLRALIASSESAAARVLHSFDGLAGRINVILDMILVPAEGKETPVPLAYDIWLAEALLNASRLWRVERVGQISTAFLLFAITSQAGGKGAHVLNALGVDSEVLRRALTESD